MNQSRALSILKTGANVFLTGEPGAGKTYVLNQYIAWLEAAGLEVAVTASTGIAATHIGGMTIHSWSGIGARDTFTQYDLDQIMGREKTVKRIKKTHVLVIDEISMLDGRMLDMVEVVCRTARGRQDAFGGLQVVVVGDFFQLPPVTRRGETMRYAFESRAWENMRPLICYLSEQYRQEDPLLLSLLSSIRRNEIEEEHYTLLSEQTDIEYEHIEPTRLYTHNADVDAVNLQKLNQLLQKPKTYTMKGRGSKPLLETLIKSCLSPDMLVLKEDAMVMFTKNNFEAGYVNGTLGRVVAFTNDGPIVETATGKRITVVPDSWDIIDDGKILASIEQIPLRLAWAITIHKSQGMSLDAAEIDLGKAFVYGQGYVALSRVRSLAGLKVLGMHPNALEVDPKIIAVDAKMRAAANSAEDTFADMDADALTALHRQFVEALNGRIPSLDAVKKAASTPAVRLEKESTYAQTKNLLEKGLSLSAIAKERGMAESTIVGHIETLVANGEVKAQSLEAFVRAAQLSPEDLEKISEALQEQSDEKLKPLFEALRGKYDYIPLRLARAYLKILEKE